MEKSKRVVDPRVDRKIGFLVITRRPSEGVMIGEDIHVVVTRIENGQVRLGVYAPREIKVTKTEMAERHRG